MDTRKLLSVPVALVLAIDADSALSQLEDKEAIKAWGEPVKKDVVARLVADRTWHINWSACMGGSEGCWTYWDFAADGTMCARGIDARPEDKCADEGKWRIDGNALCWKLSWMGGGEGYKATCILIKDAGDGAFEATRAKGIGLTFFRFVPDKDR